MRVPIGWLRELVDVDAPTEEIADRLTRSGTLVESIERPAPEVSGVVVARVLSVADVREAKKPIVRAEVDDGTERYQVLAGVKNFHEGDLVPLARPGARVTTLPGPVEMRKMLGHESQGMLCSPHEIGMGEDHSGILLLDPDAPLGVDALEHLGLRDDVLELEITTNRPDLLSILGVAREVAVLFGAPLRPPSFDVVEEGPEAADLTSVDVDDPEGCPRYLARVITDVSFGPSPAHVQARLAACGIRPLGNLVDATNYVLELTGQPLHAFDLDRLAEQRIVVRRARDGERLETLDEVARVLGPDDLVIADAERAQAIAGVIGGAPTEVGDETRRVLLESAHFDPRTVFRMARDHDLRTGASQRFEKRSDPAAVPTAAALCAELMRRWAGGSVARGAVDVGGPAERREVRLRFDRTRTILGVDVPAKEQTGILEGLGCQVAEGDARAEVTVPSWRGDLTREIDLIEEVARIHGYDRIPFRVPTGQRGALSPSQRLRRRLRAVLLGAGLCEATLFSFLSEDDLACLGEAPAHEITNPMSSEQTRLRPSLIPGLLRAAQRNVARGSEDVRLFELGVTWGPWAADEDLPTEVEHLGAVLVGEADAATPHASRRPFDAYDGKGIVEVVLAELGVGSWELGPCERMPFHPGRSASVLVQGEAVGAFGEVRPSVARDHDLDAAVVLVELALDPLFAAARASLTVAPVPRVPPVLRDVALVVDEDVPAGELLRTIREAAGDHLEEATLLDVYRGEQIPEGRKSLAYRLVFRAADRTLTAEEADAGRDAVVSAAAERHGAELRG